ncbi:MAG: GWxTD domain-containing protein [Acidobacteriia bacterium]|nr:GWxTD domain-containing protein [Terriglobia bacterium]
MLRSKRFSPGKLLFSVALAVALLASASALPVGKTSLRDLPARYRTWLTDEVNYMISNDEREAFLLLPKDEDRDKFIEHFWELRNPTPGAPTNTYKDEIYRRITYAKEYLNGVHTDMGQAYITLGEPKQRARYYGRSEVRPMEIWFYQNTHPALPPYFYLLFYDRDSNGAMRFYSPYMDGPSRLATSVLTVNDNKHSFAAIDRALGREVARTTLSLLPDEPVDTQNATATLQSDVMLSILKTLPNHPLSRDEIKQRQLAENVSHRIVLDDSYLDVVTIPLRDALGNFNLHYVLRLRKPTDFAIGQADKRYFYNVTMTARVFGPGNGPDNRPDNKLIFRQEKEVSKYLSGAEFERIKGSLFGYEGWLALAPGTYKIDFLLSNNLTKTAYKAERKVTMPSAPAAGLHLSDVVAFNEAQGVPPGDARLPFTSGGVKFTPLAGDQLTFAPGQNITVFYQVWAPPADPAQLKGKTVQVDYTWGRMGATGESKTLHEQVDRDQFDAFGSLLTGKKIALTDAAPGNYRLIVSVTDPETQHKDYSSLAFRVYGMPGTPAPFDVFNPDLADEISAGVPEFDRALTSMAQNDKEGAVRWFKAALAKNPNNEAARARLTELYFARQDFASVAALFARVAITEQTDQETILRAAESLAKTGDTPRAITLLENAVHAHNNSGPLLLALAGYYRSAGNIARANELELKGKELVGQER